MAAKYVFKVGPANRHLGYANEVTVYGDDYNEAKDKAIVLRGYDPRDSSVWFIRADEVDPNVELLERLAKLLKETDS